MSGQFVKTRPVRETIPIFDIYGQRPRDLEPGFFHVERVSDREALHQGNVRPHRHTHLNQISCWINGAGTYVVDGEGYELPPSALTIMPSGVVHGFSIPAGTDAIVVSMSSDFHAQVIGNDDAALQQLLRKPSMTALAGDAAERTRHLFRDIELEYASPRLGQATMIAAALKLALVLALRSGSHAPRQPNNNRSELFERFVAAREHHFREHWTIARYAAELNSTCYLLNASTRSITGQTASKLLDQRILLEAKRLLLYTMLSLSEIAFTLGFDDASHFSRTFRRLGGQSPGAWRARKIAGTANDAHPISPSNSPSRL